MQTQIAGSDHSFQFSYAPAKARDALAQHVASCTARLSRSKPTWRGAAGSSTSNVPHATLATNKHRPNTYALRCSAVEHAPHQQDATVDLQSQVDRLTKLLDTLEAASGWHDKARPKLIFAAGIPKEPTTMFVSGPGSAKRARDSGLFQQLQVSNPVPAFHGECSHISDFILQAQGFAAARAGVTVGPGSIHHPLPAGYVTGACADITAPPRLA